MMTTPFRMINRRLSVLIAGSVFALTSIDSPRADEPLFEQAKDRIAPDLASPVRLMADGKPIDIGAIPNTNAHAGPAVADIDGDGDQDLLIGDFPGYFWHFDNEGTNKKPNYTLKGKLQTPRGPAKTPVY